MLNILLLCNKPNVGNDANTIVDHIEALEQHSKHKIWLCSNLGDLPPELNLAQFDVVILHYSICLLHNSYLSQKARKQLRSYSGLKVVFIQDEYRQIDRIVQELAYLNIDVLFTCFPEEEMNRIYPQEKLPGIAKYTNLTGYVPERLTKITHQAPIASRPLDVGYRGRKIPFWLGELSYEKWSIVDQWLMHTQNSNLKIDLSYDEAARIYGDKWIEFLSSCRTTLGVESGASVMDFTGELEKTIDFYQLTHPQASFHSVQKKFLLPYEGKYRLNQISPRCFEAISLKTVLVLYEGGYSGILVPDRHYIVLKKDFSNINEVLSKLQDVEFLQAMADRAFEEIALNPKYSYATFVQHVDEVLTKEFQFRGKRVVEKPYQEGEFQCAVRSATLKNKFYKTRLFMYQKLPSSVRLLAKGILRPKSIIKLLLRQTCGLLKSKSVRDGRHS